MQLPTCTAWAVPVYFMASITLLWHCFNSQEEQALVAGPANPLYELLVKRRAEGLSPAEGRSLKTLMYSSIEEDIMGFFVLKNSVLAFLILLGFIIKTIFLGRLTWYETSKAVERVLKFCMLKTVFLTSIFDSIAMANPTMWVTWCLGVGYLKVFVGLARDRFESLMCSPSASLASYSWTFSLLVLVLVKTGLWFVYIMRAVPDHPTPVLVFWVFDTAIVAIEVLQAIAKYGVQLVEKRMSGTSGTEVLWEGKGAFLFHTELLADILTHTLMLLHYGHLWYLHGISLHFLDFILLVDVRFLVGSLFSRMRLYRRYWTATQNLHQFRDAAQQELETADDCAICKESMQAAKVLPCSHIFHLACLRAWLQQSGSDNFSCPLCRMPLFKPVAAALPEDAVQEAALNVAARQPRVPPAWQNFEHWLNSRHHFGSLGSEYEQGRLWGEGAVASALRHAGHASHPGSSAPERYDRAATTDAAAAAARQATMGQHPVTLTTLNPVGEVSTLSGTMAFRCAQGLALYATRVGHSARGTAGGPSASQRSGTHTHSGLRQRIGTRTPQLTPPPPAAGQNVPPSPVAVQPSALGASASRAVVRAGRQGAAPYAGNATMFWSVVHFVGQRLDAFGSGSSTAPTTTAGAMPARGLAASADAPEATTSRGRQWPDGNTIAAVKEVLPHAPDAAIIAELQRTRDVNRAVENLIAAGLM